jgi:hypothetical protein
VGYELVTRVDTVLDDFIWWVCCECSAKSDLLCIPVF